MALDKDARDTDSTFESEGLKLLVDEQSIQYLEGCTVDYHRRRTWQGVSWWIIPTRHLHVLVTVVLAGINRILTDFKRDRERNPGLFSPHLGRRKETTAPKIPINNKTRMIIPIGKFEVLV